MAVSFWAWARPCRSGSVTFRQFWLTRTLDPKLRGHSLTPALLIRALARTRGALADTPMPASNEANPDRCAFCNLLNPCSERPWTAALARCVRDADGAMPSAMASATAQTAANAKINRDLTCSSSRDQCLLCRGH